MENNNEEISVVEDVEIWIEQGNSIHIKAVTDFGDPVELSEAEAQDLAETILKLLEEIKSN